MACYLISLYCPSCFFLSTGLATLPFFFLEFFLPRSPAYTFCLTISCSFFYYINHSNTCLYSVQISYHIPQLDSENFIWGEKQLVLYVSVKWHKVLGKFDSFPVTGNPGSSTLLLCDVLVSPLLIQDGSWLHQCVHASESKKWEVWGRFPLVKDAFWEWLTLLQVSHRATLNWRETWWMEIMKPLCCGLSSMCGSYYWGKGENPANSSLHFSFWCQGWNPGSYTP